LCSEIKVFQKFVKDFYCYLYTFIPTERAMKNLVCLQTVFIFFFMSSAQDCKVETSLIYQSDSKIPEASDITKVWNDFYIVGDDTCAISKLSNEFDVITLPTDQCSGKSDFEALFRLPNDTDIILPTLVICKEDAQNCSPWWNGAFVDDWPLVDGGEGCHDSVSWNDNKGIEGAHGFLSNQGEIKMLVLIELDGKLITYKLVGGQWISESCMYVPVDFDDYSGLSILGSTMAVVSQKSRAMFVTTISDLGYSNFTINEGEVYKFDRRFEGVEGIFLETTQPGNVINGVISSDNQGSGNYANAVHAFSVVCDSLTTDSASTTVPTITTDSTSTSDAPVDETIQFYLSTNAHCDKNSEFIKSESECEQAAASLNLIDTTVLSINNEDRPYGCFFKASAQSNQLWLNEDTDADKKMTDALRQSVCKRFVPVSQSPTLSPATESSSAPTFEPSNTPSVGPSYAPTVEPSNSPTVEPSTFSTEIITSLAPSIEPSATNAPSFVPTFAPTANPIHLPSSLPTAIQSSLEPTLNPTPTLESSVGFLSTTWSSLTLMVTILFVL